ncbi:MAG: PQQ-binding-like beta-propeller repeat protein [Polyangiales bacterium]
MLGESSLLDELPALPDLVAAATALASGARRKVILALSETPAEIALVRRGEHVLVDGYGTESIPEIFLREREVGLRALLDACALASSQLGQCGADAISASTMLALSRRAAEADVLPDPHARLRPSRCSGGSLDSPGAQVPLAFGFEAEIAPSTDAMMEAHAFADVHALLFHGSLWAFAGQRRVAVLEGPIVLAAQRMLAAVRALCEAWQADRNVHVRLRSGGFWVAVRRERGGNVALTLSNGSGDPVTWPALDVDAAALPILRLASDLLRKLIATDRRQTHNLRVAAMRSEIRALRRIIRARGRRESFENADPDRLRMSAPHSPNGTEPERANLAQHPAALRYTERWSVEVDGLDAGAVHLCGERLVLATQKLTLAVARATGEALWSHPTAGARTMIAGRTLLRLLPDGALELHEVESGNLYARARLGARAHAGGPVMLAGGGDLPPMAIMTEARQHVCAIDLRTGQPRWRFRARGSDAPQLARNGRVLCVTSGDGTVDALDVATGEVVWRFGDGARFCLRPALCREVAVAVSGEPRGGAGTAYGIELFSGKLLWQRELAAAPSSDPIEAGEVVVLPYGRSRQARLLALEPRTGEPVFDQPDPGLDNGGQALCLDRALIVNTPAGRVHSLDLASGETVWQRALSNPLTDDVPRQLEPVVRQGALFVPSAQVHVLRPLDGSPLSEIGCDLVPDCLRVDERGCFYVAEESGHLSAYAPAPHLRLVR